MAGAGNAMTVFIVVACFGCLTIFVGHKESGRYPHVVKQATETDGTVELLRLEIGGRLCFSYVLHGHKKCPNYFEPINSAVPALLP